MRFLWAGLATLAGLDGTAGVALAAIGAHKSGNPLVTTAAYFLLFHAAAITSLCAFARTKSDRAILSAALLIALGVVLFSSELAVHGLTGFAGLSLAAPTGGLLMIVGWLVAAVAMPLSFLRGSSHKS